MNGAMLRERLSQARSWASDRMGAMNPSMDDGHQVAFTASEPKPIEATDPFDPDRSTNGSSTESTDYPDGFGATSDMTPESEKAGSRS
jgi:hypothetical protein